VVAEVALVSKSERRIENGIILWYPTLYNTIQYTVSYIHTNIAIGNHKNNNDIETTFIFCLRLFFKG
jgi:hypothetical protein